MKKRKRHTLLRLLLLLIVLLVYSNYKLVTRGYTAELTGLPPAFEGYKLVQISDLHGRACLSTQLLKKTEAEAPDLIVLTGDIIDDEAQIPELEPLLRALTELAPCYYVTGNHEWARSIQTEQWIKLLTELGIIPLRNSYTQLIRNGESLTLAGVEDPNGYADMLTPEELARKLPEGVSILLCHRPDEFPRLAAAGCSLVLSGHVHGGLIRLPYYGGLLGPGRVFLPEYDGGLYEEAGSKMIVSRGLAGSAIFPRLFNAPELTVITLSAGE